MSDINLGSLTDYYTTQATNSSASALQKTLNSGKIETADDEALMDAAKEFEAYFVEQVFKEMKNSIPTTESSDAGMETLKSYYNDELTREYAKSAVNQGSGFGLAQSIYEQMKRNQV